MANDRLKRLFHISLDKEILDVLKKYSLKRIFFSAKPLRILRKNWYNLWPDEAFSLLDWDLSKVCLKNPWVWLLNLKKYSKKKSWEIDWWLLKKIVFNSLKIFCRWSIKIFFHFSQFFDWMSLKIGLKKVLHDFSLDPYKLFRRNSKYSEPMIFEQILLTNSSGFGKRSLNYILQQFINFRLNILEKIFLKNPFVFIW